MMYWPVQSSHLNAIEHVWNELDRKVRAKQATSAAYLWQLLQKRWAELSSVYNQFLLVRMSRICEAVIAAKGRHFEESKVFFLLICI